MVVCSVSTVVFNGNPLMRYDGYYVLADWLEIPNLRDRCNRYMQRLVMEHCLGIEVQPEPYMALWRRLLFLTYAIVSWVYRWVVTFVILKFMASFLKPYKLEVISTMLAAFAAGSMIGWPLFRLGKNIHKRGRLPDMKPVRATLSAIAVAVVLVGFFFVPLPVSRVRQTGVVEVQPEYVMKVFVEVSGTLDKVHVQEGQTVRKGTTLAEFSNLELQAEEASNKTRYNIAQRLLDGYNAQLLVATDPQERRQLQQAIAKAGGDLEAARLKWEMARKDNRQRLVLRAPCDGVLMGLPNIDEIGKRWDKDQSTPFCSVGNPARHRVLVPVSPDEYELIRSDRAKRRQKHEKVPVTIRVEGRAERTWSGEVAYLPESEAKEIPPALTNKAGGPLAIKPNSQPHHPEPQSQVYLLGVNIDQSDSAIVPGVLAQVKIHCEYRSCAWWAWRSISSTFDLSLL
jgi:putative peptide zinc metalloprotease protein